MAELFTTHLDWTGAGKGPTQDAVAFSRDLEVTAGETRLLMSSAPAFRGDAARLNPEQLFVASVSACHALTFLFLAARSGVSVLAYTDDAEGHLAAVERKMRMTSVTLRPLITLEPGADEAKARELIDKAHRDCFIGNSVTAAVVVEPTFAFGVMASHAA